MRFRKDLLLVVLGVWAGYAQAAGMEGDSTLDESFGSPRISAIDHLIASSSKDPNDPNSAASNLLLHSDVVSAEYQQYRLVVQFTNRFSLTQTSDPNVAKPFVLDKATASAEWETWDLKGGDTHQEWGRGIALSLYRDDVFGLDNTLQGAVARYHPKGVDATILGGRINSLVAPVAINPIDNPLLNRSVYLAGTSVKTKLGDDTTLGTHYFYAVEQPNGQPRDASWHTVGATLNQENMLGGLDAYLESNLLVRDLLNPDGSAQQLADGMGTYIALSYAPGTWKTKWELKDYRNYWFEWHRPPTLEEDMIEVTNLSDVTGTRLSYEQRFSDGRASAEGSWLWGYDRSTGSQVYHGVVGTKFKVGDSSEWEVKGGYRWMPDHNNLVHGDLKGRFKTFKGQALEIEARTQYANLKLNLLPYQDDRNVFTVTYTWSEHFTTGLGYEYVPSNDLDIGQSFYNGSVSYKTGSLVSKAFVGQTSGGTLCSGGICRQVPPYSGAMLETTVLF
jgi:Family of unknown function (DUF6029)